MESHPTVAIVGRPNVGKSTLFNRLVGRRISIEDATPGTTRDRVAALSRHGGRAFEVVDTGGIGIVDREEIREKVEAQIARAVEEAAVVVFVVDVREGLTPPDEEIARDLHRKGIAPILVANKADSALLLCEAGEFAALGFGDALPVSARSGAGFDALRDLIVERLPAAAVVAPEAAEDRGPLKLAIVGAVNVGKSTLVNALCGDERVIVSEIPGTTRDSVDVQIEREGRSYTLIDTAGLRRRGRLEGTVELWSQMRARDAIARADAVLFMLDATRRISQIDKAIGCEVREAMKATVILVNKWDRSEGTPPERFLPYLHQELPGLGFAPIVFCSAEEEIQLDEILDVARSLDEQAGIRVETGPLNRILDDVYRTSRPRPQRGVLPKVYYITQTGVRPPTFVVFCNKPGMFRPAWRRFLENKLREVFGFSEVPLRLIFRERAKGGRRTGPEAPEGEAAAGVGAEEGAGLPDGEGEAAEPEPAPPPDPAERTRATRARRGGGAKPRRPRGRR